MNEAIAPMQIVWVEQVGHDLSVRFVTPPRHWKAQGTPCSADTTKPGFWGYKSIFWDGFTPTSSCSGYLQSNLPLLRKVRQIS